MNPTPPNAVEAAILSKLKESEPVGYSGVERTDVDVGVTRDAVLRWVHADEEDEPLYSLDQIRAAIRAELARPVEVAPVPALRHVANEWADAACNGLQWLRNIEDGISTPDAGIANMLSNIEHCREVESASRAPVAVGVEPVPVPNGLRVSGPGHPVSTTSIDSGNPLLTPAGAGVSVGREQDAQDEEIIRKGLARLTHVVDTLRADGRFVDDEGEDTEALADLGFALCKPAPAEKVVPVAEPVVDFRPLILRVHKAKGRHNTQIAMCDLFDAAGLFNVRPGQEPSTPAASVPAGGEVMDGEIMSRVFAYGVLCWNHRTDEAKFLAREIYSLLAAQPILAQDAAPVAVEAVSFNGFLCRAWGETDLPCAEVVSDAAGISRFMVREWLGGEDAVDADGTPTLQRVMYELKNHDWGEDGEWSAEFEIGGVSVEPVYSFATPAGVQPSPVVDGRDARGKMDCSHSWTEESAANGWRSSCRHCGLNAAGSCQG